MGVISYTVVSRRIANRDRPRPTATRLPCARDQQWAQHYKALDSKLEAENELELDDCDKRLRIHLKACKSYPKGRWKPKSSHAAQTP